MNKAVFILPFFGRLPNYFQLFLNSCKTNHDYDWIIFTDDKTNYIYPDNVNVIYITFDDMVKIIQSKFDFKISLEHPKKLCDFKPLYGYIFSSYIDNYEYWGYCDCDLIFGKISDFVNFKKLACYSKIGIVGHLALMKNEKEINEFFYNDDKFIDIESNPENLVYDEGFDGSVNNVLIKMNKKIYNITDIADISCYYSDFRLAHYSFEKNKYLIENRKKQFFVWDNGKIIKYFYCKNKWQKKEYIYIHLQKRDMVVNNTNCQIYKIIPNSFEDLEQVYFDKNYYKVKRNHITFHKIKFIFLKIKNKIMK